MFLWVFFFLLWGCVVGGGDVRLSYSLAGAAECVGVSVDVIKRAVRAGDLATFRLWVNGRFVEKPLISREELEHWIRCNADHT